MKRLLIITLTAMCVCCLAVVAYWRYEPSIHFRISKYKEMAKRTAEYEFMHKDVNQIDRLPQVTVKGDEWFCNLLIISHAGGINGCSYTNSVEAWEKAYAGGNRLFDADITFTSDSVPVLKHSWMDNLEQTELPMNKSHIFIDANSHTQYHLHNPNIMDYQTFMATKIHKYYTPMSMEDMVRFMQTHPDVYVIPDIKGQQVVKGFSCLLAIAKEIGAEEVLDRIVVSLYRGEEFDAVEKLYPFRNKCMRQFGIEPNNYYEMASYCVDHNITAINMSKCYTDDPGAKALIDKGFRIYVALIDYPVEFDAFRARGFHGCVSNWLTEIPPTSIMAE